MRKFKVKYIIYQEGHMYDINSNSYKMETILSGYGSCLSILNDFYNKQKRNGCEVDFIKVEEVL